MDDTRRVKARKRRRFFSTVRYILECIICIIGLCTIITFAGTKILGYNIEFIKSDLPNSDPKPMRYNSPNSQHFILQEDNAEDFWQTLEEVSLNPKKEVIFYTAIPYEKDDGTWENFYILSYDNK